MRQPDPEARYERADSLRRSALDVSTLSEETRAYIASDEFQAVTIERAKRAAAAGSGLIVFIGNGDLGHRVITELTALDPRIVSVGIDSKITVGTTVASYVLYLGVPAGRPPREDDLPGLLDTPRLIALLARLAPSRTGPVRRLWRVVADVRAPARFAPLAARPMVVGEYHGLDARQVFTAAVKLGYQVLPDRGTATLAMDKVAFWQRYSGDARFGEHLPPQRHVIVDALTARDLVARVSTPRVEALMAQVREAVSDPTIGLPCMVKPSIAEFGYGQVKLERLDQLAAAMRVVAEQSARYRVNPGGRVVIEPFIERKRLPRLSPNPFELMQIVVRHRDQTGRMTTTCLPPIWFTNHAPRPDASSQLLAGPQVFDFAVQAPVEEVPELFSPQGYARVCQKSVELVESMTRKPGLFGLEIFPTANDGFLFTRLTVRTQDTMFATLSTQPRAHAFAVLARLILNQRISTSDLAHQLNAGGVKTIVYEGGNTGHVADIAGKERAEGLPSVAAVDVYFEKTELYPLRRYGLIFVKAPRGTPIARIVDTMGQARGSIEIKEDLARH